MRALKKHLQNPEKLIRFVKNGFDVYTELELSEYREGTFYEAAIRWGTPELVKACIESGANPNFVRLKRSIFPYAAVSTVVKAMKAFRPDNMKVLLENGANLDYLRVQDLNIIQWHMQRNLLPEYEHLQDFSKLEQLQITTLKKRLDAGTEIIRILNEAGFHFSGMNRDDTYSSFYSLGYWAAYSTQDDEGE